MPRWRPTHRVISILFLISCLSLVNAQDECILEVDGVKYDLTSAKGEHSASRTRDTPPSTMRDAVRFDLCAELGTLDGVDKADQCPKGTRACLTKTNTKGDSDRIIAVVPVAQTEDLKPQYSALSSPKGLSITLHGSSYPSSSTELIPQSFNISLLCATEASDPIFKSYEAGQVGVEWSVIAGCGFSGDKEPPKHEDDNGGGGSEGDNRKEDQSVGSGIGWFFLVLLLAFMGYFLLGAYYNYTTYGSTGIDLVPHRDFWREAPYMLRDVVSHLCGSFRQRHTSSRGGYIAV